jgi:hypothetical protein
MISIRAHQVAHTALSRRFDATLSQISNPKIVPSVDDNDVDVGFGILYIVKGETYSSVIL